MVHRIWHWVQGLALEDPSLPFTYQISGISGKDLEALLGQTAVNKLFPGRRLIDTDVVSEQVRQLIDFQLRKLQGVIKDDVFQEAKLQAQTAITEYLPKLQEDHGG